MKDPLIVQFIALLLFCSITADAQKCKSVASPDTTGEKILLISDNQEHMLTGTQTRSMSGWSDLFASSYALRSPLANIGGRSLMEETLQFGKEQGAGLVLHLGDASDISCPTELNSVFETLDAETNSWFFTPGNHDGLFAGNFSKYQPGLNEGCGLYTKSPKDGYGIKPSWLQSCYSPSNHRNPKTLLSAAHDRERYGDTMDADVLTKKEMVQLYLDHLSKREIEREATAEQTLQFAGGPAVQCRVDTFAGSTNGFKAVARLCPRTGVDGKTAWFGAFSSFIVQKLEIAGAVVLLIDTSDYYKLDKLDFAGEGGGVQKEQMDLADTLLGDSDPGKVIIAGHHAFGDLPPSAQRWIAERAGRYLSGHAHHSTRILEHTAKDRRIKELNIGSTIDHPQQAVIASLKGTEGFFRVAGADVKKTVWPGFLKACKKEWKLEDKFYKKYRNGRYINRLLDALREAAKLSDSGIATPIPTGELPGDWAEFEEILNSINRLDGDQRKFWACQAYYASEATKGEKSVLEVIDNVVQHPGKWWRKAGCDATGGWYQFSSP